ncbi:hypothetical protein GTY87_11365 [Streptomyces sp. SID7813]|uniref:Uncharacterized protein n=1 Tax=Streptomyces coelicolor (strain ATCC BAA-471 / A3(2) / M145) TaxID=100226 RepID=Q9RDS0_STRCO|nr:hypothetical protein [Streptomyces sp. SID7813]QFI47696.1 hypothetical protein FQ762_11470 [Streptomyces coelicolor A3(2)]CAB66181.1 hypothetical protein SC1G2.09c [Streptomyces coelicolor A3(2)]
MAENLPREIPDRLIPATPPRDRISERPRTGEPLTLSGAAGTAPHVRVTQWPYPGTEQVLRL